MMCNVSVTVWEGVERSEIETRVGKVKGPTPPKPCLNFEQLFSPAGSRFEQWKVHRHCVNENQTRFGKNILLLTLPNRVTQLGLEEGESTPGSGLTSSQTVFHGIVSAKVKCVMSYVCESDGGVFVSLHIVESAEGFLNGTCGHKEMEFGTLECAMRRSAEHTCARCGSCLNFSASRQTQL